MILVTELAAVPILSKADPDVLAHVAQAAVGEGSMAIAFVHQFLQSVRPSM